MKANKAPEKIILSADRDTQIINDDWVLNDYTDNIKIEYTRTDVFIEKALKWYCLDCECNDNCKDTKCFFYREFERYLKGGANALPPKISGRILDEDGSISDNWRYRHFMFKMQDAFIEKARKWFEEHADDYNYTWYNEMEGESGITIECIEDFINYIKGE